MKIQTSGKFLTFLKGVLMGICDIIPGISGGTIAFITGIYERLINSIRNFSPKLVMDFFRYIIRKNKSNLNILKEDIKKLDLVFLITLFAGIGSALLIGSRVISFLLKNHFTYTISFFIGLILASSKVIFDHIESHNKKNIFFGFLGLISGIILSVLIPVSITPNLGYIFMGGFLAVSAMFLPGISGAFILLILGLYEFLLNLLHNIFENLIYSIVFILGAILGAVTTSRIISFLFEKDKCKTLYFLLGLVIGSLSIPIRKAYDSINIWAVSNISIMLIFSVLGITSVVMITKIEKVKKGRS